MCHSRFYDINKMNITLKFIFVSCLYCSPKIVISFHFLLETLYKLHFASIFNNKYIQCVEILRNITQAKKIPRLFVDGLVSIGQFYMLINISVDKYLWLSCFFFLGYERISWFCWIQEISQNSFLWDILCCWRRSFRFTWKIVSVQSCEKDQCNRCKYPVRSGQIKKLIINTSFTSKCFLYCLS